MHITPARRRVLMKANAGFVMRLGGFGAVDAAGAADIDNPLFDRGCLIDRLIADGLLTFGRGWNQYVLTWAGARALQDEGAAADAS